MHKAPFFSLNIQVLVAIVLLLSIASCKSCDDRDSITPCRNCGINEECYNGSCICKAGSERYNGTCVSKSSKDSGIYSGWSMFLPKNTNCFTFDSTGIIFPNTDIKLFADTTAPATIADGHIIINKYYNLRVTSNGYYYHKDQIEMQNAVFYRDHLGVGIRFTLGNFSAPPTFRPLTQYGDTVYWTKWEGRFSDDMSGLKAKVVLLLDKDRDRYHIAETPVDSCIFEYEKW